MNNRKISLSRSTLAFSGGVLLLGAAALDCSANSSSGVSTTTGIGGSSQTGLGGSSNTSTGGGTNGNTGGNPGATNAGGAPGAGGAPVTGAGGATGAGGLTGVGGGVSTGAGGATQVVEKLCAHKIVAMNPVFTDFETYNGVTDFATMFVFPFGGAAPGTGTVYGGAYAYSGVLQATGMSNYVLSAVAGHTGNYAAGLTITNETQWGGALGFWLNCVDASSYRGGLSFWARGMSPRAVFGVSIDTEDTSLPTATNPAGGGTCVGTNTTCKGPSVQEIPLTLDWTQHQLPWSSFVGGLRGGSPYTLSGSNIVGITFSVGLVYENCVPIPGVDGGFNCTPTPSDFSFQIDEISFIP